MSLSIAKDRIALIPGSGVDVNRFTPLAEPVGAPTFGFVGQLLHDKAIRTLGAAHRLLRRRIPDANLLIAGAPDPANPASVTEAEGAVLEWRSRMSQCCRHGVRVYRYRRWRRRHAAALWSQATFIWRRFFML
jgi:glycosyltransferase involved in cell wall biosynthesis